jgi:peptide/nickel transport system ATP-binding protein/oligopeptide transport system ATP-binding protein
MAATNGNAAIDVASLEADVNRLEVKADNLKLWAQRVLSWAAVIALGVLIAMLTPWAWVDRAPGVAAAKSVYGYGLGWVTIGILSLALIVAAIGFASRAALAVAAGSVMALGIGVYLVYVASSIDKHHPFLNLGKGAAAGAKVEPRWGIYLALALCFATGAGLVAVAVLTWKWDRCEKRLDAAEDTLAADKPGLLRLENLVTYFPIRAGILKRTVGFVHAVDGVDLTVYKGETIGLVGESGCGKTTLSRTILKLIEPTSGRIYFNGSGISRWGRRRMRAVRREMQIVFQDPYASLNPRMTVRDIVSEPLRIQGRTRGAQGRQRIDELLRTVGLSPEHANRFPHEFSGGQRQRIGVARALALNPQLIILDEPVSALDVSIRAQVVNLLESLQRDFELTYIFVAHDLSVVRHVSDRVAVMYLGKIVELGTKHDIYDRPAHPYTQALLSAVPIEEPNQRGKRERIVLEGDVPSPANPPSGCRFRTRCWKAQEICAEEEPALIDRGQGHPVACHFAEIVKPLDIVGLPAGTPATPT